MSIRAPTAASPASISFGTGLNDMPPGSVMLITDHIIDLSDLVLVFFDARHPESGAMGDTLKHLVAETVHRPDSNKFLYILNQIDNAAREDNPEEVVAAWQRALAQKGLTAGSFSQIYDPASATPIISVKQASSRSAIYRVSVKTCRITWSSTCR